MPPRVHAHYIINAYAYALLQYTRIINSEGAGFGCGARDEHQFWKIASLRSRRLAAAAAAPVRNFNVARVRLDCEKKKKKTTAINNRFGVSFPRVSLPLLALVTTREATGFFFFHFPFITPVKPSLVSAANCIHPTVTSSSSSADRT